MNVVFWLLLLLVLPLKVCPHHHIDPRESLFCGDFKTWWEVVFPERDTESRYHSVVSYITYLLKRPFFPVLGLVPIWTKIILLLSQISAHSLKLVWTQHYGPDALKQQSMSRWILARLCWAESRLIRLTHSCRQNTELPRIATIFT